MHEQSALPAKSAPRLQLLINESNRSHHEAVARIARNLRQVVDAIAPALSDIEQAAIVGALDSYLAPTPAEKSAQEASAIPLADVFRARLNNLDMLGEVSERLLQALHGTYTPQLAGAGAAIGGAANFPAGRGGPRLGA